MNLWFLWSLLICAGGALLAGVLVVFIASAAQKRGLTRPRSLYDPSLYSLKNQENADVRETRPAYSAGEAKRAFVRCSYAPPSNQKLFSYKGYPDCRSLAKAFDGNRACKWSCLGRGDCARVCPQKAIVIKDGLARVGSGCAGCGECAAACPRGIIELIPLAAPYAVSCSSRSGKKTENVCSSGCTGCTVCARRLPYAGISIENSLARLDYDRMNTNMPFSAICPSKCIVPIENSIEKNTFWSILIRIQTALSEIIAHSEKN